MIRLQAIYQTQAEIPIVPREDTSHVWKQPKRQLTEEAAEAVWSGNLFRRWDLVA